jgi:hypothetical protein
MLPVAAALPLILIPLAVFVSSLVWMARSSTDAADRGRMRQQDLSGRGL